MRSPSHHRPAGPSIWIRRAYTFKFGHRPPSQRTEGKARDGFADWLESKLTGLRLTLLLCALGTSLPTAAAPEIPEVAHRLDVHINPADHALTVEDEMRLPEGKSEWTLLLHADFEPEITDGEAELTEIERLRNLRGYRLRLKAAGPVTIRYSGRIQHGLRQIDEGMGRTREWSLGVIGPEGVFLNANSGWYPQIPDTLQSFQLDVHLPAGWIAVSQGAGPGEPGSGHSTWTEPLPQDDIYLISGPYHLYRSDAEGIEAQVYLHEPDQALAERYLEATGTYLAHYSELIGPYPFAKFALVENFWDTGYGMPSFTLLGPQVIRLPFIIHTSYPHEILHNWWGNSVFIDFDSGNWSEGLTYYLADYWIKEQAGQGDQARRDMLKRYGDYVQAGEDFPLVEFRGKHNMASQGVGYSKAAMFFHMLRQRLGDSTFEAGLRRFYADNKFRKASYEDLRAAFEAASGQDLKRFFTAWTTQPGAPLLGLEDVRVEQIDEHYRVTGHIQQRQSGADFPLRVPVVVTQEDQTSVTLEVESNGKDATFSIDLQDKPTRIAVDPNFDVFRTLLPGETPVTLSSLFGSDDGLILIPKAAPKALRQAYRQLATAWQGGHRNWRIQDDDAIEELPRDRPVWLLGWENRHLPNLTRGASDFSLSSDPRSLTIRGQHIDPESESPVLTRRNDGRLIGWVAATDAAQVPALARKLPHYGNYSFLVFSGPESSNRLKGQWPPGDSALVRHLATKRP
ncbi:M1 family metallopeptidase [Thiorhodococcus mannitoliphagus]|uniref:M1 family metallopeptidase n=1 Tax=Thiorhodococcus mannitoliphagus TaxID=329406 RepID=A0A6P1DYK2_9GAMM|nr:M1 family metallopeptidase [Thiorhodococcus mannitoliphagus]NEX20784.1 M1 family metallopeptidase [Thiorhodococcus mannitoliphagus]